MGGGNRNSQSKAERRIDRKQRREAANRQSHRDKEKAREKEIKEEQKGQPKKQKPWKRRDRDGSIVLWNAIKISKTSGYVLGGMLAIVILFAISPVFEDPNYVEPERYSFAECEEIDFEDMYCIYDFKWTREYADGGTISEYAEFDPFVDLPDLGDKYTPEEQDFLPPTEKGTGSGGGSWAIGDFILPLAYGQLDEFGLEFVEDDLPESKEDLTKLIEQIRLDLDMTQTELMDIEHDLQQWNIENSKLKNDKFAAESKFDDAEDDLAFAERTYRHAQDMVIRNNDDRLEQDAAFLDYKIQVRKFINAEKNYNSAMNLYNQGHTTHRDQENKEVELNNQLDDLLEQLTEARTKLNLVFRDYQFINVNLSKTCQTLIKYNLQTNCPTYREMVPLFDNTLSKISGEFVEVGYDIKRLPSPFKEHWKYYEQLTQTKVVSIDADTDLFDRGINITIQAKEFTVLEETGKANKSPSFNSATLEQVTWHNVFVDSKCEYASVGPDLQAIEDVILHVLNKCKTDLSEHKTITQHEPTIIPKEESAHWKYLQWISNLVKSLHDDSNTK
jgi:hypothetical protein